MDDKQRKALDQAIASVEMEGFKFSDKKKKLCEDLLDGVIPYDKFLADCKAGKLSAYLGR
ncbi:MAG: antitoxin VbhA family protein [Ruminococcus sp.]|nr:antitoxin VbhA family protein [Ruminococcus sp.]